MSRIAKADVNRALKLAAATIIDAGGKDGRTSRAEIKAKLATLPAAERKLADIFFKFVDARDFRAGAQVTAKDVSRAVEYAQKHMVAKYDLNNNGLSKDEISKMSLTGKRAVDLSIALKAAGASTLTGNDLALALHTASKDANYMSESDYTPEAISGRPATSAGVNEANLKAAFGSTLTTFFKDDGLTALQDMAFDIDTAAESKKWIAQLAVPSEDDDVSAAAFGNIKKLLDANLTDVRVVKVGPKDDAGKLASDQGLYAYLLVGKDGDGQLSGVMFGSVET